MNQPLKNKSHGVIGDDRLSYRLQHVLHLSLHGLHIIHRINHLLEQPVRMVNIVNPTVPVQIVRLGRLGQFFGHGSTIVQREINLLPLRFRCESVQIGNFGRIVRPLRKFLDFAINFLRRSCKRTKTIISLCARKLLSSRYLFQSDECKVRKVSLYSTHNEKN